MNLKRRLKRALAARGYEVRTRRSFSPGVCLEQPWALVSYLAWAFAADDGRLAEQGHTNAWASREFAMAILEMGYNVLGVDWRDEEYSVDRRLAVVVDIGPNLGRRVSSLPDQCTKILYCTTSDPYYQNAAEASRVAALNERRGVHCSPRRQFADPAALRRSLEVCDIALLDGNEQTLSTYPEYLRHKIALIAEPGSDISGNRKAHEALVPQEREFLWFFGAGAIHKGLDLVLEVFARHPELTLHIVGNAPLHEPDFARAYRRELTGCDNIRVYGALNPASREFALVAARCAAFVAPSCSESTSSAVVTCLKVGLYPIISRDCGFSLPGDCGTYLADCSVEEIERAVLEVCSRPAAELEEAIVAVQSLAHQQHSKRLFANRLRQFLQSALSGAADSK